jgi:ribonuclease HI
LNFDGASRGNPGIAGIGGAIRNQAGEIIHIFCRALGESTNNEAEFAALEQGLKILRNLRRGNIIVEGDSLLAIMAAKRLQSRNEHQQGYQALEAGQSDGKHSRTHHGDERLNLPDSEEKG